MKCMYDGLIMSDKLFCRFKNMTVNLKLISFARTGLIATVAIICSNKILNKIKLLLCIYCFNNALLL